MPFITSNLGQYSYFQRQLGRPRWRGKKVLDFGGNIGNMISHPASAIEHDNYWCIDISKEAINRGRQNHPNAHFIFYNRYNFEYNPEGIEGLEVPDTGKDFDYILALSVFTHTRREEMIDLASHLKTLLAAGGCFAFTFLDPHYTPADSDMCNLENYLRQRPIDGSYVELDHLVAKAQGARWCVLANGSLKLESEWCRNGHAHRQRGYLAFYTPEYLKTIFPDGEILPPVKPYERQHCCIIRNGK
jgi:SAM-dependent methyltransferase